MDITNTLKAVIILDPEGKRALSHSFSEQTSGKQFEKNLYLKTKSHRNKDEVLVMDNLLVLHRFATNLHIYVIGSRKENPLILDSVMVCLVEVFASLLSPSSSTTSGITRTISTEPKSIYDNLTQVILALDEICDQGIIMETDSNLVLQRVLLKDDSLMESSMAQKLQMATEHIKFPWIRSWWDD